MIAKNKEHVNRRWLNCTFVVMVVLAAVIMLGVDGCPIPWPGPTQHLSPPDGSVFDHYPRTTTLEWTAVTGAVKYKYEVEYYYPPTGVWSEWVYGEVNSTSYTFDFVGAQPGRWRITPINAQGVLGTTSGWWEFEYTI